MQDIHNQLKNLPKTPNPLTVVSSSIAEKCRILCIDEFHVDDITDAMIMARLLDSLFEFGVTLVTSSNIAPIDLYKNGLQRERFLPAIDLIISNTQILHLDNGLDYRVALLEKHGVFLINADTSSKNDAILEQHLVRLANNQTTRDTQIELNGRQIQCRARSDSQIWFDFCEICETPRSSIDYIALAKQFEAILISNIPIMDDGKNDVVQRFIQLVDATYDHRVKLIVSAFAAPNLLYAGKGLNFPFQRTISRLYEMRSEDYLKLPHID